MFRMHLFIAVKLYFKQQVLSKAKTLNADAETRLFVYAWLWRPFDLENGHHEGEGHFVVMGNLWWHGLL